jgi:ribosomal protein L6P/L9E
MRVLEVLKSIEIPKNVDVNVEGRVVTVKGEKGVLTRSFSHAPISIKREGDVIKVQANNPRKKEAALVGTLCSHIQNMINGVKNGFTYKLKIVFSHYQGHSEGRRCNCAGNQYRRRKSNRRKRSTSNKNQEKRSPSFSRWHLYL